MMVKPEGSNLIDQYPFMIPFKALPLSGIIA
jgi:hypothetical protein